MSLDKFEKYEGIPVKEIPRIPLYMDQVTGWFEEILDPWGASEKDKALTKTMINNYVKAKLVTAPEKKKYSPEQLMQLMMIYHLKNILTIEDLRKLLDSEETVETVYEKFHQLEQFLLGELRDDGVFQAMKKAGAEDKRRYALQLALEANIKKKLAEELIGSL